MKAAALAYLAYFPVHVFAFTATFGRPEVSRRKSEKRSRNMVACAGGRVL